MRVCLEVFKPPHTRTRIMFRYISPSLLCSTLLILALSAGCHAQDATPSTYETFRAFNNVRIQYAVHLPEGYDANQAYPAVVAFPGGDMRHAAGDAMTAHLWGTPASRGNWIVVVPLVPGDDWRTHPNHHALEDLLDHIKDTHRIQGDAFHLVGYQEMGTTIASTWSGMSRKYWISFTAISGVPYQRWDDRSLRTLPKKDGQALAILMVYSEADLAEKPAIGEAQERMKRLGVAFDTQVVVGDGEHLSSLANGQLLARIAEHF